MNNTTAEHLNNNPKKSSGIFSKAKSLGKAVGFAVMGVLGAQNADAQIQELGTIDDGQRNSWLLRDMGQQHVYWNSNYPKDQRFTIRRINTPDPENRRQNYTNIFESSNTQIITDNIWQNSSEIIETNVQGRHARKIHHDQLAPWNYIMETLIYASHWEEPTAIADYVTRLFVEVDEDGNQKVFKIDSPKGIWETWSVNQYVGNLIGGDAESIEFTEKPQGEMQISIPVSAFADGSSDLSLDLDEWRQTGAKLVLKLNDGSEIVKSAEDIDYDLEANTLTTTIHQNSGQYIVAIATQHDGLDDIEVTGPTLDIASQMIANAVVVYPNPVRQGDALTIQVPEGLRAPYAIYDMTGRVVMQGTLDDTTALMHTLSSGAYMLKIQVGQSVHSQKFLVQ